MLKKILIVCFLSSCLISTHAHAAQQEEKTFFNSYTEAAKTYAVAFSLGYGTGIFPPIAPLTAMVVVMGAFGNPNMSRKKEGQWLCSGEKIWYTYLSGTALGFITLTYGTVKGTLWAVRKLRGH